MSVQSRGVAGVVLAALAGAAVVLSGPRITQQDHGESSPAYTPEAAARMFELAEPGMRLELVASEPEVMAPVAIRFDEDGRLWVVEMPSYMLDMAATGELEPVNRISVLEDVDGDGRFETRRTFLDKLKLPRGVMPCYQVGGRLSALVIEPPEVYFAADTDGDGRADTRKAVLARIGGLENPEHAPNGLLYGMDNWIEFSQHSVSLKFDGERGETRATPGHGQWGITMDDLGRVYYTPNSDALRVDAVPKWFAARWQGGGGLTGVNEASAVDQLVWPQHPTPGVNRGYQPGVLREDGRLRNHTAACSPTMDRGGALGTKGSVYVCEPAGNMVRRLVMKDEVGRPRARNAYDKRDLLTSSDERFRPVATAMGPDGALYIADMYRGVIQHKNFLTPQLKAQVKERGLEQPTAMGRIWRLVPEGNSLREVERLSAASDERLVEVLGDEDGWRRDAAQRLLVERRAVGVADRLRAVLRAEGTGQLAVGTWARVHAMWTLEGLGVLTLEDVTAAAGDVEPELQEQAARVLGGRTDGYAVAAKLLEADTPRVRWHAALALGSGRGFEDKRGAVLVAATVLRDDPVLRSCVVNALAGAEEEAIRAAMKRSEVKGRAALISDLVSAIMRGGGSEPRASLMDLIASERLSENFRKMLIERVEAAIGIGSSKPRPVRLSREPKAWIARAVNDRAFSRALVWFDWPGRPEVDRGTKAPPLTADQAAAFERGRVVFTRTCAQCHGFEGRGVPGQTPPLAGSQRAAGDQVGRAIRIVLHGMDGSMERDGVVYNGQMPAASGLSDQEIADALTFVRRSWGNAASPVSGSEVLRTRMKTVGRSRAWTVGDIDSLPEEKP